MTICLFSTLLFAYKSHTMKTTISPQQQQQTNIQFAVTRARALNNRNDCQQNRTACRRIWKSTWRTQASRANQSLLSNKTVKFMLERANRKSNLWNASTFANTREREVLATATISHWLDSPISSWHRNQEPRSPHFQSKAQHKCPTDRFQWSKVANRSF